MLQTRRAKPWLWQEVRRFSSLDADWLLKEFNIAQPPIPVSEIVESLGIHVWQTSEPVPNWRGAAMVKDGQAHIWLNHTVSDQRFILAHELGHVLLHEGELFRDADFSGTNRQEREANAFAGQLILPSGMIRRSLQAGAYSVRLLAAMYAVSEEVMWWRLVKINPDYAYLPLD